MSGLSYSKRSIIAAVAAVLMSSVAVGAAVGAAADTPWEIESLSLEVVGRTGDGR